MHSIVFIHPNEKLLGIYRNKLSNYFSIDSASDGLSGLRLIKSRMPSLVISDYQMPKLSGVTILKHIRSHPTLSHIPYIFLSASHPDPECLGLGASDWLLVSESTPELLIRKCHQHLKLTPQQINRGLKELSQYV